MPSTPNLKTARSDAQGFSPEFAEDSSGLPLLLSATEAARQLGLAPWTIRYLVRKGELGAVHFGRRVLVPRTELLKFIASLREKK
jgi:excisionase family DNA binding protein